jgi:protein arginine kinase activator
MEFRAQGRLGCPHDYHVFRTGLVPLLQRIHRHERHVGKRPRQHEPGREAVLVELRRRLRQAVEGEAYEEAARIRDLLRKKEATDESG